MDISAKYGYTPIKIDEKVTAVKAAIKQWSNSDTYIKMLGMIDLTTLTIGDTPSKVAAMVKKVSDFNSHFPTLPIPASICVYPNFAKTISIARKSDDIHITVVAGGFPASQSFLEIKIAEAVQAVKDGADEVDIVLAHNAFNDGRYMDAAKEISSINSAIKSIKKSVCLKVILETGSLGSHENIAKAAFLAMESGADFIKTSTGKTEPAATPEAAVIMCECIAIWQQKTGKQVGFKAAGGISNATDAALYYGIVDTILGDKWLSPQLFRFGASRLANNLISAITSSEVSYY
ncbi:MAG: deoxyribose-phosphate aldolase [Bacteroidales bacterium]|nr:deoxyribose-phosphate aldolase [Bacteroidales bacterium]